MIKIQGTDLIKREDRHDKDLGGRHVKYIGDRSDKDM